MGRVTRVTRHIVYSASVGGPWLRNTHSAASAAAHAQARAGNVFGIMPSIIFLPVTTSVAVAYVALSAGPLAYYM